MTWLTKRILDAMSKDGCVTALVYGDFGAGKTAYALHTAREVYGDWRTALDWLFFSLDDAMFVIMKHLYKKKRINLIIFDDAGLWLNRTTWWEQYKVKFMEFFNLIRSVATGIIFTTPSDELPHQVLNKITYKIRVEELNDGNEYEHLVGCPVSRATIYKMYLDAYSRRKPKKVAEEVFPRHYPIYEAYMEKRWRATRAKFSDLVESHTIIKHPLYTAYELLMKGYSSTDVIRTLHKMGVSRVGAYKWVKKLMKIIEEGLTLEEAMAKGLINIRINHWRKKLGLFGQK